MCGELLCKQGDEEQGPSGLEVFFFCGYSLAGVWKLVPQSCLVLCEFYVFSRRVCTYFISNFGGSLIMISDFNLSFVLDENGRIQ